MSYCDLKFKMDHKERGIALLINMHTYKPNPYELEERKWSKKDVANLINTLNYLEFRIVLLSNLTKSQLEISLREQASHDHTDSDCFLCVVMSHGNDKNMIYTSDSKEISFEEIMAPIKFCQTLISKPKLFFFQSCRGNEELEFVTSSPPPNKKQKTESIPETSFKVSESLKSDADPFDGKIRNNIENESDLLVFYSTISNHVSWANESEGTTFIKSFCDVFGEAYKNLPNSMSLSQMIMGIKKRVSDQGKQLAETRSVLVKEVYFTPKNLLHNEWIEYLKRENKSNFDQIKNYYMPRKLKRQNEMTSHSIEEEHIFSQNNEKLLIISAEPGMGKSAILDHFTQNSNEENFFIKITLNTCTKVLSLLRDKNNFIHRQSLIDFIFKSLLEKKCDHELFLLKHMAKEEKLILMFDGLDEVSDYKEQVIHLIEKINTNESFQLKKILLTTRNHLREELENFFQTSSFNLNNFDEGDQKMFLIKYWRSLSQKVDNEKLEKAAGKLIDQIKLNLTEDISKLIGIPLQTKMLGDIFFEQVKKEGDFEYLKIANIADLYAEFIEAKITIQFSEKNKRDITREKRQKLEREKKLFYSDHIKLASTILFDDNGIKHDLELSQDEILEYGVVVNFKNELPFFLHRSFAEFFWAKHALNKLEQKEENNDEELEQILREEGHFLIRRFLNDLIKNVANLKKRLSLIKDYYVEIENCCKENLISLLRFFLEQKETILNTTNEFLIIASIRGHEKIVEFLIEKGININQQDKEDGSSALIWACSNGHKKIVQMLLEQSDININQPNEHGRTALHEACRWNQKEIVQILLDNKNIKINQLNKYGRHPLQVASSKDNKEIVQILLEHKDINLNQTDNFGDNALHEACRAGKKDLVQELLDQKDGIDINQKNKFGSNALILSSEKGDKEIVKILLEHKDINVNKPDDYGNSALMWASDDGHKEIVQMLLGHKDLQLNQQNSIGSTALTRAAKYGHKEIVQMLLKSNGIEINLKDKNGQSALILASANGQKEIVQILLGHDGIIINQKDKNGRTALTEATRFGHKEIVDLLREQNNS